MKKNIHGRVVCQSITFWSEKSHHFNNNVGSSSQKCQIFLQNILKFHWKNDLAKKVNVYIFCRRWKLWNWWAIKIILYREWIQWAIKIYAWPNVRLRMLHSHLAFSLACAIRSPDFSPGLYLILNEQLVENKLSIYQLFPLEILFYTCIWVGSTKCFHAYWRTSATYILRILRILLGFIPISKGFVNLSSQFLKASLKEKREEVKQVM